MRILFLILAVIGTTFASPIDNIFHFNGYQVIRTFPNTKEQYDALKQLEDNGLNGQLDFWTELRKGRPTDIMVAPTQLNEFISHLSKYNIQYETSIPDVEKIISEQREASVKSIKQDVFNWDDYQSFENILAFLHQLAKDYPNLANVEIIGKSTEGKDIALIKISTGGSGKRAVYIDGNIHAREWISPAVVTYIINELVTNSEQNSDLLRLYDFYIVPSLNPDGYEHSRNTYRLWRKTRSNNNSTCLGVDANRNYDYLFGPPGSSSDKCAETYHGPKAFSEPENNAVQEYITKTNVNWAFFLTFHSYGQYVLLPYGDGSRPADYSELLALGNIFKNAVYAQNQRTYTVGNTRDLLYTTSGTSQDWAKLKANIKYSYTIELRDTGYYGFLLPKEQIKDTASETFAGLRALLFNA